MYCFSAFSSASKSPGHPLKTAGEIRNSPALLDLLGNLVQGQLGPGSGDDLIGDFQKNEVIFLATPNIQWRGYLFEPIYSHIRGAPNKVFLNHIWYPEMYSF